MVPSGMGVTLAEGAGEEPGCPFMSGIGVGMTGSGRGMLPSGSGVGLAADFGAGSGFGVALWTGVGEEDAGMGGSAPGAGYGARVGSGAGMPIGAIEGSAPGVGNPDREFVWPGTQASEARKIPPQTNSFLNVDM